VTHLGESSVRRNLLSPVLYCFALDFDASAALAACQVVVVAVRAAAPVQRLATGVPNRVDLAAFAQHLQMPVNGGETDVLTALPQLSVNLLGTAESLQTLKHGGQRLGLAGAANPGAAGARWRCRLRRTHTRTVAALALHSGRPHLARGAPGNGAPGNGTAELLNGRRDRAVCPAAAA
jgi:hypothetical protein